MACRRNGSSTRRHFAGVDSLTWIFVFGISIFVMGAELVTAADDTGFVAPMRDSLPRQWPSQSHKCIHDRISPVHTTPEASAVFRGRRGERRSGGGEEVDDDGGKRFFPPLHDDISQQQFDPSAGADADANANSGARTGPTGRAAGDEPAALERANTEPLRMTFRFLTSKALDASYACGAAGEQVLIGTSSTASQVCSDDTPDAATFTYRCNAADVLTAEKEAYLRTALADTASFFGSILRVGKEQGGRLTVPTPGRECGTGSYGVDIPDDDARNGFTNTTYVMYVTARPVLGTTLAYATACPGQFGPTRGRPLIGFINFSPSQIVVGDPGLETIARHEATHALGFSFSLFTQFKPPLATAGSANIAEVPATRNGVEVEVPYLVTPRVTAEARAHFGCNGLPGGELEGGGGTGTRLSHWEQRIFGVEYMVGTKSPSPIYSKLTMALFEDTGWYFVDILSPRISKVNPWGKDKGCDFAMGSCVGPTWKALGAPYYCESDAIEGCSVTHIGTAVCAFTNDAVIPPQFQHYPSNPNRGGINPLMDYCPVLTIARLCSNAADATDDPDYLKGRGEAYGVEASGASGRCLSSSLLDDDIEFRKFRDTKRSFGCYMTRCRGPTELGVKVRGHWYSCSGSGGVRITNVYGDMDGEITCPDASIICQSELADTTWPKITAVQ